MKQSKGSFLNSFFSTPPFIGLDLGVEKINMVQVDFKSGKPEIIAACSNYNDAGYEKLSKDPKKFKALIKSTLKSNAFKGNKVIASVPSNLLKIIFLNFQCKTEDNESQAILQALKQRVQEDLSNYVIDYILINPQATQKQVNRVALVAMAKENEVENFLDLLNYSGLSVEALEIGPVAIKRLVSSLSKANNGSQKILAINFGSHRSYLTVIWNKELLLDRKIDFGMENILNAITQAFNIDEETALKILHTYSMTDLLGSKEKAIEEDEQINDIKTVLVDILKPCLFKLSTEIEDVLVHIAAETRGGAVEQIYLLGSLARISNIDQIIDQMISIPVESINPFLSFSSAQSPSFINDLGPLSGVAVATGLSMRGQIE